MKNQEEQLDKFFSKGLAQYEEAPSLKAWDAIEQKLPQSTDKFSYWIAASVAVMLIAFTIVWNNVLNSTPSFNYETASGTLNVSHPQKEFIPIPVIIYSTKVVYIENEKKNSTLKDKVAAEIVIPTATVSTATGIKPISSLYALDTKIYNKKLTNPLYTTHEPIIIIYKKGDPKHPKLAKAASFIKQVGEGERPLINFEKISAGLIARRETTNNSNN